MNKQLRWTKNAESLCAELGEQDGIDPRYSVVKSACKKATRKDFQLCKKAARVISLVLAGETHQALLRDLIVLSVQPEGQQLCVTLGYCAADIAVTEASIQSALKSVQGQLRSALAHALHRKQTPLLSFRYVGVIGKGGY